MGFKGRSLRPQSYFLYNLHFVAVNFNDIEVFLTIDFSPLFNVGKN